MQIWSIEHNGAEEIIDLKHSPRFVRAYYYWFVAPEVLGPVFHWFQMRGFDYSKVMRFELPTNTMIISLKRWSWQHRFTFEEIASFHSASTRGAPPSSYPCFGNAFMLQVPLMNGNDDAACTANDQP